MKSSVLAGCTRVVLGGLVASMPATSVAKPAASELPRGVVWRSAAEVPTTSFLGPAWRAALDATTRVPSRLWGPGLPAPGTVASPALALGFARAFLAEHLAALAPGSSLDDFELVANDLDAGQRTVAFAQRHRGIPVLGGQLSLRFKNDRLFLISSQAVPVTAVAPASTAGAVTSASIYVAVAGDDGRSELRLARPVVVAEGTASSPSDRALVFVDAVTGETLARRSLIHDASATLRFNAPVTHAGSGGTRMDYPASLLGVTLDGASAETTADGVLSLATSSAQLTCSASGRFVDVVTAAGTAFAQTLTASDGSVLTVDQRDDEIADAQLSAYVHVNLVKDWARKITGGSLPWLDDKLVVNVNQPSVCNAYYDGGSKTLNFFQSGPFGNVTCQNTALVADVIHHEFGHALHDHAIIPGAGQFDSSMSEGLGDYVAATMSNDPRMGRGFYADTPDVPMRNLDDVDRVLPDDVELDVHTIGLIFGGAMWDLRKSLTASSGAAGALIADRLLYQGIRRATDMSTAYLELLAADDDDGNLVNGTPHGCAITAAFAAHGLVPDGAYGTAGVQRPVIDGDTLAVLVRPSACPDTAITALTLDARRRGVAGTERTVTLTSANDTPDADGFVRYEAALPYVPDGGVLQYRITAALAGGGEVHYPNNAADPYYEQLVGEVTPVLCDSFDGGAYPKGFTHKLTAGDQGYGADEWMWGPPRGGVYSGDPLAAYSGDNVFGTDLGGSNSEGWYAPDRSSRLSTPVLSLGTLDKTTRVHLQYRRWVALGPGDRVEIAANDQPVWSSVTPGPGVPIHRDREWRFHDVDVTDQVAANGSLRIDFSIIADGTREGGGWNIDDLCVVTAAAPTCTTADCGENDAGGCGCGVGSSTAGRTSALLGLAVLLVLRRRRPERSSSRR